MDPKRSSTDAWLAPGDSRSSVAIHLPGEHEHTSPPYVDERLVEPETREEIVRGQRLQALPANPEHGDEHTEVTYVVRTHVAPDYTVSTDLLTRASPHSDFATDTCVRRSGIDPRTQSRYLEELAFEVVNEQSMAHMVERAQELTSCGVRRLIAIFVKKGEISEWSAKDDRWIPLDLDGFLQDPTLIHPFPLRALLDAATADDALVDALAAKNNRRLVEIRADGVEEGERRGLTKAIEAVCELLDIPLSLRERVQMRDLDTTGLESLLERIKTNRRWP